jgi:hypothetical protein
MLRNTSALGAALVLSTLALAVAPQPAQSAKLHTHASSDAEVRVVHGSPDAGPVTVAVNGSNVLTNFLYGTVTGYISLPAGTYSVTVTTAGGAALNASFTLAAGTYYSVVATGELSPAANPGTPNIALTAYVDKPFSSGSAINFHHAAPVTGNSGVPFGYALLSDFSNKKLGEETFGKESGPVALPSSTKGTPLEIFAVSDKDFTLVPNQISPADFDDELPSKAGADLSVFAVDGPGAAADPTVSGTDVVRLIGAFDKAGT